MGDALASAAPHRSPGGVFRGRAIGSEDTEIPPLVLSNSRSLRPVAPRSKPCNCGATAKIRSDPDGCRLRARPFQRPEDNDRVVSKHGHEAVPEKTRSVSPIAWSIRC